MNAERTTPILPPPAPTDGAVKAEPRRGSRRLTHWLAWVVLGISLAASLDAWLIAHWHDALSGRRRFDEEAGRIQTVLSERMAIYQDVLHGALGLYAASYSVERAEWKAYTDTVSLNKRLPGMNALGFIAHVPRENLDSFLKTTRADKTPDFQLRNPGTNHDLLVIKYLEPEKAHAALIGTDIGEDPHLRQVAEQARDTAMPVISGKLNLPGPKGEMRNGVMMLLPVFRNGTPRASVADRRANIEGWVFARLILDDLMLGIVDPKTQLLRFEVLDETEKGEGNHLFDSEAQSPQTGASRFSLARAFVVGTRQWELRFSTKPAFDATIPRGAERTAAAGGIIISLLLFGIALSLSTTRARAVSMAEEMTAALREANHRLEHEQFLLRTLMDNLPDRIYFKDTQSRFLRNSRGHLETFGLKDPKEAIGKSDFDFFAEEHARQAFADEQELMRSGQPITKEERETWPDGSITWALSTKLPLRDEQGRTVGTFGISRDITDRKRAEEAMRQAKEAAEEANRIKSQFLANMSHELRTPLNSVIGFASILLKNKSGNLRPTDLSFLDRIQANGKHLLLLINDILDLSKIEARKVTIQLTSVALDVLVRETIAQQEGLVRDRPVSLLADVPDTVSPITADAEKLRQVIINLIGNALKFTERGSVTVRLVTEPTNHRPLRIEVTDTGIGIPQEKLGVIFQAFQQADASTARKYGGTGLGLTISQALCQLMGFRIEVASQVGRGSTFSVILDTPAAGAVVAPAASAPPQTDHEVAQAPSDDLKEKLVLVIDDDSDSRVLLTHMLEEIGCQVIAASSGEQGIRIAREFRPHLITVDLLMPQMDGTKVIRALKADPRLRDLPLVVVSIAAEDHRGSILGAVDVLVKPVTRAELLATLQRNLLQPKARILVVDDDEDARRIIISHLADEPIEVQTAANGREALERLEKQLPDLILLDLVMPLMGGGAFLEAIRLDPRFQYLPVVVTTSQELSPQEREHLRQQTMEVVKKTELSEENLKSLLLRMLRQAEDRRQQHATRASAPPGNPSKA